MHVYMDAVLYPNIYKHDMTFRQEGWSYKLDSIEDKLEYLYFLRENGIYIQ